MNVKRAGPQSKLILYETLERLINRFLRLSKEFKKSNLPI